MGKICLWQKLWTLSNSECPAGSSPPEDLIAPPLQNNRVGTLKMLFVRNSRSSHAKPRNSQPVKSVGKKNPLLLDFAVSGIRHSLQSCSFEKLQCQACSQWGNIVRVWRNVRLGLTMGKLTRVITQTLFSLRAPPKC